MLLTGTTMSDRGRYTAYGTRFTVHGLRYPFYGPLCTLSRAPFTVSRAPCTVNRKPFTVARLHQPKHLGVLQHFAWVADLEFAGHHGHHWVQVAGEQFGKIIGAGAYFAGRVTAETFGDFELAVVELYRELARVSNVEMKKGAEAFYSFRGNFFREGEEKLFYVHVVNVVNLMNVVNLLNVVNVVNVLECGQWGACNFIKLMLKIPVLREVWRNFAQR